jgi:hypothetical protein
LDIDIPKELDDSVKSAIIALKEIYEKNQVENL